MGSNFWVRVLTGSDPYLLTFDRNLYPIFLNGGPQVATWGGLLVISSALAQAASLAETAAMLPIAGAQYHVRAHQKPITSGNALISWLSGLTF